MGRARRSSGIPRGSRDTSRETSPSNARYGGGTTPRTPFGSTSLNRSLRGTPGSGGPVPKRPQMTERLLNQSREAESALADALVSNSPNVKGKKHCLIVI